jgi:cysteine-rich repeat protein
VSTGPYGYGGCSDNCTWQPRCGDGVLDMAFELCDDGFLNGYYGHCGSNCQPGRRCGDGFPELNLGEQCDDGVNDGSYGACAPGCVLGPHCGDGVVAVTVAPETGRPYEQCDDGNDVVGDGCSFCLVDSATPR